MHVPCELMSGDLLFISCIMNDSNNILTNRTTSFRTWSV